MNNQEDLPELVRRALGLMCGKCGAKPAEGGPCPYAQELHGDDKECDCCEACRYECSMDI